MESIGSRKYHTHSLEALEIPRGWGSLRPTFLIYSLYEPKMNISRGEVVGQTNKLSLGNMDTLEQDTVNSEA